MAPTLVREPFHRDGWVYEEKVDGWRILGPTRPAPASAWSAATGATTQETPHSRLCAQQGDSLAGESPAAPSQGGCVDKRPS
jgi:hypothetical protein